jgi:hypothetical protein
MSKGIDFSKPLSDEDRTYLEARGRYADIERTDNTTGVQTPPYGEGDGTGLQPVSVLSSEVAANRKAALLAELAAIEAAEAGSDAPAEEEADAPYTEWTLDELKAEIDRRNESREGDARIAKTGSVKVLADRLYGDDETSEEAPAV